MYSFIIYTITECRNQSQLDTSMGDLQHCRLCYVCQVVILHKPIVEEEPERLIDPSLDILLSDPKYTSIHEPRSC